MWNLRSPKACLPALLAAALVVPLPSAAQRAAPACAPGNAGLTLPDGFCAVIVAEDLGPARHIAVAPNGDVFVALGGRGGGPGVVALRDTDGDGVADVREQWGDASGNGIALHGGYLYQAPNDGVMRYPLPDGSLTPSGPSEAIVTGLPAGGNHPAKSIAIDPDGNLYVNMGSATNSCQEQDRRAGVPGMDPCTELDVRAGIWRFDANRAGQTEADGVRFATGLRNTVGLTFDVQNDQLYGGMQGRDQLADNWGFETSYSAENPAEELVVIDQGDDFGWPYCYYSNALNHLVLAPEYGGDGEQVGRCADKKAPAVAFPGHWAPIGVVIYRGSQFPERYRGGAFVSFHGSWNRAPEPQAGYNVTFAPFENGMATGSYEVFADGFAGADKSPAGAAHRPTGVAVAPDGSLLVSDDVGGTLYRIVYTGM